MGIHAETFKSKAKVPSLGQASISSTTRWNLLICLQYAADIATIPACAPHYEKKTQNFAIRPKIYIFILQEFKFFSNATRRQCDNVESFLLFPPPKFWVMSSLVTHEDLAFLSQRLTSPVDSKEQSQGCHCLFPTRQVVHGPEALARGYTIIIDTIQIRLLRVFRAQESLKDIEKERPSEIFSSVANT